MPTPPMWLRPPHFDDELQSTQAISIYNAHIVAFVTALLVGTIAFLRNNMLLLWLAGLVQPFIALAFLFLKRKKLTSSVLSLLSMLLVAVPIAQVASGEGIRSVATFFYIVALVLSARFLSRQASAALFVVVSAVTIAVAALEWYGFVSALNVQNRQQTLIEDLIIILVVFSVSTIAARLMVEDMHASLTRARQSEERYRLVSDLVSDYVFESHLDAHGTPVNVWTAGAFEKIHGYSNQEFAARGGWRSIVHPEDLPQDDQDLRDLKANKKIDSKIRIITKTGQVRWVRILASPIWDAQNNRLTGIYGAVQDITSQEEARLQIQQLNAELEQRVAERTAALQQALSELEAFSYSISHDLRSPLRAVSGYVGILLSDYRSSFDNQSLAYLKLIENNARRMGVMIDGLVTFLQLNRKPLRREIIDTNLLVQRVVKQVTAGKPHLDVRIGDLPPCNADYELLAYVFTSLVSNAVKFSQGKNPAVVQIGVINHNNHPAFFVRDNGVGFDMKYQSKLFGVFQKLHAFHEFEGEGLSLAIAQRIIHRHGGQIWAEAEVGQGATFYFTLE